MSPPGRRISIALLLLLASAARAGEEVEARLDWRIGEPTRAPHVTLELSEKPPEGVAPLENVGEARYLRRRLGGSRHLLVAAHFRPEPVWIRVDRDFDGSLSDETPILLSGSTTTLATIVRLTVELDPARGPEEIPLRFVHHHRGTSTCLHFAAPVHREGELVLEGRLRRVAFVDGDADLVFDDPEKDSFVLDVDGDTELTTLIPSHERLLPGAPFRLRESGYRAEVEADGRVVFRREEKAPPPAKRNWKRLRAPKAGLKATGKPAMLSKLEKDYARAEKEDAKAGQNVVTARSKVVAEIGKIGTEEAFLHLLRLAEREPNAALTAAAIRATGYAAYAPFAGSVVAIVRGSDPAAVRMAAIQALHGMDAPGREAVLADLVREETNASVFGQAARHLAYLGTESGQALLCERAAAGEKELRFPAYQAATRYREAAPPAALVVEAAKADDPRLRVLGLEDAFLMDAPEARSLALGAMGADEKVQVAAVRILGAAGDPEDVAVLLAFAPHAAPAARAKIVTLLRPVRGADSVAALVEGLSKGVAEARALAAEVLEGIHLPEVRDALVERLGREKDGRVVAALIRALAGHGADDATPEILKAANAARKSRETLGAALDALARFGLSRPGVLDLFEKIARSRDPEERLLALEAAGRSGDLKAVDLLLGALDDKAWRVRLTAVQGLGLIRVKRAVPPLIERLAKEESPRIRAALAETLRRVTGMNFYDIVKLWKRWWKEYGEAFVVPDEVKERTPDDHAGRSVASFYGVPVESDRIVFVIDQSGSMSAAAGKMSKLERAVEQTLAVVAKLEKSARINVILFETTIHTWQKGLVKLTGQARAALAKHLRSKRPMGGTNLYDGLETALLTKDVDTVYLLSDGAPGAGKWIRHEDILREVREINRTRKVAIHCVAVGFDSPLLKALAAQNDGMYVRR